MPRGRRSALVPYDPVIERTFRTQRARVNQDIDIMQDTEEARARLALMNARERVNQPRDQTVRECRNPISNEN